MCIYIAALSLACGIGPAFSQWIYQGQESAFGDSGVHVAPTGTGNYAFGIRCRKDLIEVIYFTPDTSFDAGTYKLANITEPKFKVRVDDGPVVELPAELSDVDGKASVISEIDLEMVLAIRDAKKRVAGVLELLGEHYHEKSFNVRGSTKAIGQILAGCGLSIGQ